LKLKGSRYIRTTGDLIHGRISITDAKKAVKIWILDRY
jgi:hypothetical protein